MVMRFREVPFYFADRQWGESKMSFRIQREAAVRVWQMLLEYRGLRAIKFGSDEHSAGENCHLMHS